MEIIKRAVLSILAFIATLALLANIAIAAETTEDEPTRTVFSALHYGKPIVLQTGDVTLIYPTFNDNSLTLKWITTWCNTVWFSPSHIATEKEITVAIPETFAPAVEEATASVPETVTPTVEEATASVPETVAPTVAETIAPAPETITPTIAETTAPVSETIAPTQTKHPSDQAEMDPRFVFSPDGELNLRSTPNVASDNIIKVLYNLDTIWEDTGSGLSPSEDGYWVRVVDQTGTEGWVMIGWIRGTLSSNTFVGRARVNSPDSTLNVRTGTGVEYPVDVVLGNNDLVWIEELYPNGWAKVHTGYTKPGDRHYVNYSYLEFF